MSSTEEIPMTNAVLETRAIASRQFSPLSAAHTFVQMEQMRGALAGRLHRVCADMPPQEFATLVSDICAMKLRWAQDARPQR